MNRMPPYKWSREEIRKMIEMVEERDCLWNMKKNQYHNQTIRQHCLQEIEVALNIPVVEIKRKLHTLRAQYSKECIKMKMTKSDNGSKESYKTKWEFFGPMKFMFRRNQKKTVDSMVGETTIAESGVDDYDVNSNDTSFSEQLLNKHEPVIEQSSNEQLPSPETLSSDTLAHRPARKQKTLGRTIELQEQTALNHCMAILSEVKPKDEFAIFGEYVGNELRLLSKVPDIQLRLKYDIQQLIVNASFRNLSRRFGERFCLIPHQK